MKAVFIFASKHQELRLAILMGENSSEAMFAHIAMMRALHRHKKWPLPASRSFDDDDLV
jgi:hypothetical protein